MKRRDFLENVFNTFLALQLAPSIVNSLEDTPSDEDNILIGRENEVSINLQNDFSDLIVWLKLNRWSDFFKINFNVDIENDDLQSVLPLNPTSNNGFEDFAGIKMIEPGLPSMSLLYHALASPRVKPKVDGVSFLKNQYPSLEQLDILENYIYALKPIEIKESELNNYVLAVFAYEYRPAYKTPSNKSENEKYGISYAEFVFSRTGISRIGECEMNYDTENRCFTNKPINSLEVKKAAITPAKYGLFLAKKVKASNISLLGEESKDKHGFSIFKKERDFLKPIRKIFDDDLILGGGKIVFNESHRNEKLYKLSQHRKILLDRNKKGNFFYDLMAPPFIKESFSDSNGNINPNHNYTLVNLTKIGSSVLVKSVPGDLIKVAKQDNNTIYFNVPGETGNSITGNRRYTSLKLQDRAYANAWDYAITEGVAKKYKATRFSAPRNAPLFTHIRTKVIKKEMIFDGFITPENFDQSSFDYEEFIKKGGYASAMFEDNICDGCVTASIVGSSEIAPIFKNLFNYCLPAFSIVTAPDFFPFADSYDFEEYDKNNNSSFMEGGTENLSVCRLSANPRIMNPITGEKAFRFTQSQEGGQYEKLLFTKHADIVESEVADTMIAVFSVDNNCTNRSYDRKQNTFDDPRKRDYNSTSYLADTASFVFAPGWDVTYSADEKGKPFLATFGLGSPFPEDMKLCAAANGMWPVTSPDAARTFQGGLDKLPVINKRTPCAIPLMDDEIGIHATHPALSEGLTGVNTCYGWDGEHGPFLQKIINSFEINFVDIGRSDYVYNMLTPDIGFSMEKLRELTCQELVHRIDCLRACKVKVEGKRREFSKLWLISAEKVNWDNAAVGIGVPKDLVGDDRNWAIKPKNGIAGNGYLYVFADPIYDSDDESKKYTWESHRRRRIKTKNIYVCQVTENKIAWCVIPSTGMKDPISIVWKS